MSVGGIDAGYSYLVGPAFSEIISLLDKDITTVSGPYDAAAKKALTLVAETSSGIVTKKSYVGVNVGNVNTPVYFENGTAKACKKMYLHRLDIRFAIGAYNGYFTANLYLYSNTVISNSNFTDFFADQVFTGQGALLTGTYKYGLCVWRCGNSYTSDAPARFAFDNGSGTSTVVSPKNLIIVDTITEVGNL